VERLSTARRTKVQLLVGDIDDKLGSMRSIGPPDPVLDQELTILQDKLVGITVEIARVSDEHDDLFSTKPAHNESEIASRGAVLAEAEDTLIQSARALLADTTRSYLVHGSQIPPLAPAPPLPGISWGPPPPPKLVGSWQIKVFYATDRKPSGNTVRPFTNERDPQATHYGSAVVSFPSAHTKGLIEEPQWWRFQFSVDASKHVVSYTPVALDKRAYLSGIKTQMNISSKRVLIFIHGYNSTFEETILRTAQIAKDLHFNGVPIAYDWTSAGNPALYGTDERAIQSSLNRLKSFLFDASRSTGASSITVIAHSMGSQILLSALTELSTQNLMFPIDNLIFAAPDVDTILFTQQIAQLIESNKVARLTLYASSWDFAVALAAYGVNHASVAGQAGGRLFIWKGIDTIDASRLPREDFFGHSYFADTIPALQDLAELINFGWGPQMRSYLRSEALPSSHWALETRPH
jgi:esterase/lipase superfamily enzyme